MTAGRVRAALVDLDDTLYPQASYLDGAWQAVAARAAVYGVPAASLLAELTAAAEQGSDRGGIIDRAVAALVAEGSSPADVPVPELVEAFRRYRPTRLPTYPGVRAALRRLRSRVPLALVTDGAVDIQQGKLRALGLVDQFDVVVLSDAWGREHRKPAPLPFREALRALGVPPDEAVMIGDRPDKDVAGAASLGIRTVRVRTGEYRGRADEPEPWATVRNFPEAVDRVLPLTESSERQDAEVGRLYDDQLPGIGRGERPGAPLAQRGGSDPRRR